MTGPPKRLPALAIATSSATSRPTSNLPTIFSIAPRPCSVLATSFVNEPTAEHKIWCAGCVSAAAIRRTKFCVQQTKIAFRRASPVQRLISVRAKSTVRLLHFCFPSRLFHTAQTYADDILLRAQSAKQMAKRIAALMQGCETEGDLTFDLGEDKSKHLKGGPRPEIERTTWEDVARMTWTHKCQHCERQFPTQQSRKAHQGHCRWKHMGIGEEDDDTESKNVYEVDHIAAQLGPWPRLQPGYDPCSHSNLSTFEL